MIGRPAAAGFERARLHRLSERYRRFATNAFAGESELYEKLTLGIAGSRDLLAFIADLPVDKRQPQLFLAALRHLYGVPENVEQIRARVREDPETIRKLMLARTTQTNEPARCSVLLPLLARLPQPLAIIEVGASAGLCLLPDKYGYDYGAVKIAAPAGLRDHAPIFACATSGPAPLPRQLPHIGWRMGLDLNPIDVASEEEVAWLETLVWPEQRDRARLLRAAIDVARLDPPAVVAGDLLTDLADLLRQAPRGATPVVFHTGVLQYVPAQTDRNRFVQTVKNAGAVWISNEAPTIFLDLVGSVPVPSKDGQFLLMLDGVPVAWTGPHGQSLEWFGR